MYRVQFYCPRQMAIWQDLQDTFLLIFSTPATFPDFASAQRACNGLLWRYHSARVIDPAGNVVYQV